MFELGVVCDYYGVAAVAKVGNVGSTGKSPVSAPTLSHSLVRSLWQAREGLGDGRRTIFCVAASATGWIERVQSPA